MNENENNVTELQNNVQTGPTVEFASPDVSTTPAPETPQQAEATPSTPTVPPKKNNKILIIILIVVLLLGVGAWYVCTQTDLFESNTKEESKKDSKKKNKDKDKEDEDEDEDDDKDRDKKDRGDDLEDEELAKTNGIYKNGDKSVKIYPLKNGSVFYYVDDTSYGFVEVDGNFLEDESFGETISFEVKDNEINAKFSEYPELDGTYKKETDYTEKDLINDVYGDYDLFINKYNGHYTKNNDDLYLYQLDEDTVRVIILSQDSFSSFDLEFDIVKEDNFYTDFFEDSFSIDYKGDTLTFNSVGEDHSHDGTYTKVGPVDVNEILEFGLY